MSQTILDQVILVDAHDQQIGVMDKLEAHRGAAKLHRAISVFLFNSQGELLMQQRSDSKIVGAGQWTNTCCGNVRPGESYEQCAMRRLREELGITDAVLTPIEKFQYAVDCNDEYSEHEMDQVFVGKYETLPDLLNAEEVSDVKFMSISEIKSELADEPQKFTPWFPILLKTTKLTENI